MDDDEEFVYSAGELDDEEEDEDVDWEDVDTQQQAASSPADQLEPSPEPQKSPTESPSTAKSPQDAPEVVQEPQNLQQIDWGQLNQALAEQDAVAVAKKRRRAPIRLSKAEKQRERALHQSHLLVLLASRIKWTKFSTSQLLQGLMLSITAESQVDFFSEIKLQPLTYSMELLVRWFRQEFELVMWDEERRLQTSELITESSLMDVFYARKGRDYELVVLFAALCGALQLRYRLTSALDPVLVQRGKAFELSFKQRPSKRRRSQQIKDALLRKKARSGDNEEEKGEIGEELGDMTTAEQVFWLWCEVLDGQSKTWVNVDPVHRLVGRPLEVEPLRGTATRFSYVLSIQDDGLLVDVTSRYTTQWSKSLDLRLADSWLKQVIEQFNDETVDQRYMTNDTVSMRQSIGDADKVLAEEKCKLELLKLAEGMPTSFEGFRKHHIYCLERHLGQLECIHPRKVVGLFNGIPVFSRAHVQPVKSAFKWRRCGREVMPSERNKPARWQSRGDNPETNAGGGDDSDTNTSAAIGNEESKPGGSSLALFGLWQTIEFVPPPMVDGCVPKNKYGNIEIWSPAHVPRDAVHLRLPRIDSIAESLGIDFAPAVVGFEMRNGRTMPKVSGIVVARSAEAMLLDAHAARQHATIEKAVAHNQKLVVKRWEKLTKRLLLRQRLEDDYGAV